MAEVDTENRLEPGKSLIEVQDAQATGQLGGVTPALNEYAAKFITWSSYLHSRGSCTALHRPALAVPLVPLSLYEHITSKLTSCRCSMPFVKVYRGQLYHKP